MPIKWVYVIRKNLKGGDKMLLNLKAFRVKKGFTQEEFAEIFGVNRVNYIQLEQGKIDVKKKHMDRIIELYPEEKENIMELFENVKDKRG